jgi:hypothetical protein
MANEASVREPDLLVIDLMSKKGKGRNGSWLKGMSRVAGLKQYAIKCLRRKFDELRIGM